MLSLIMLKLKERVGLYCEDGLAVNATPQQFEKTKQEICKAFEANNLSITMEANKNCKFLRRNLGPNQPKP